MEGLNRDCDRGPRSCLGTLIMMEKWTSGGLRFTQICCKNSDVGYAKAMQSRINAVFESCCTPFDM